MIRKIWKEREFFNPSEVYSHAVVKCIFVEITATFLNVLRFLLGVNGLLIHKNLLKARNYPHILHTLCRPSTAYLNSSWLCPSNSPQIWLITTHVFSRRPDFNILQQRSYKIKEETIWESSIILFYLQTCSFSHTWILRVVTIASSSNTTE